jgi:NAD(P)-dependent dehydrogenase (short-subunit alcohol dehydrogenase family)
MKPDRGVTMDVRQLNGKTALITGAASGIGRATALACASRGARLVICDQNEEGLAETEREARALGCEVLARRVDVGKREEVESLAATVHAEIEAVDLLVNNAGVGLGGAFLDTPLDDWEWIARINLFGVIHGCHYFIPPMAKRGRGGHVVNVSSAAGFAPLPAQSAYATTKFAVLGLSESLRPELAASGIGVTAVCPGFINTPIVQNSRLHGVAADPQNQQRAATFYQRRNYGPGRVAKNILKAVQRNRAVAPISAEAWAMHYVMRFAPGLLRFVNRQIAMRAM